MLACWTGLAISGLTKAGVALQTPEYLAAAEEAAAFVRRVMYDEGTYVVMFYVYINKCLCAVDGPIDRPIHTPPPSHTETGRLRRCVFRGELSGVQGLADDHAFLARGLLDLYEATGETAHLEWAARLQVRRWGKEKEGGGGAYILV